jgi:hypothetical protein
MPSWMPSNGAQALFYGIFLAFFVKICQGRVSSGKMAAIF